MLENELFAFTLFLMGIDDSVLDQFDFKKLCKNELWSKTEVPLHIYVYMCIYIWVCDCVNSLM